jgi:hypothetical protein
MQINDLRRLVSNSGGPAHFGHVNFRGMLTFSIDKYVDALLGNQGAAKRQARG